MGFGSSLKKIVKHTVAPVFSIPAKGIEKLTGIDWKGQLGIGAGIGGAMGLFNKLRGPGTPGAVGSTDQMLTAQGEGGAEAATKAQGFTKGFGGYLKSFGPSLLGLAGNVYSANRLAQGQQSANQTSIASAREQMAFQEYMSSTAHQREVTDLKKAGLNPALSANSGAPSSAGAMAQIGNPAPDYRQAVASAMDGMRLQQEMKESNSRIVVNQAQAGLVAANAKKAGSEAKLAEANAIFQELENEVYMENGKLMLTEKGMKILKQASSEVRAWVFGIFSYKFGVKAVKGLGKTIDWQGGFKSLQKSFRRGDYSPRRPQ